MNKKKKHIYMRPTKSKGKCEVCFHINETKILSQIEDVLKNMSIPKHILLEIHDELKKSSEKEYTHLKNEQTLLKNKIATVDKKLKRARDLLLDLSLNKGEYNEIKAELEVERHNIDVKLQNLSKADDSFNETLGIIFELASKAHELFKSSEVIEKRRIISILFLNLKMDGKKLSFELRKPFDMFVKFENHPDWLTEGVRLRTKGYKKFWKVAQTLYIQAMSHNGLHTNRS